MSSGGDSHIRKLVGWYRSHVKPFLTKTESQKGEEFDRDSDRLEAREKRLSEELAVCFLGNSGVGKSTLINALVAGKEILLPAGGVGPLTAQALTVRYSNKPRFEVHYHSPQKLRQVVFALEQIHKKDSSLPLSEETDGSGGELDPEMIEEIRLELELPGTEAPASNPGETQPREQYKKQAQLMVKGNQDSIVDLPYLIDSLRYAGGWKLLWDLSPSDDDLPRLHRLQNALDLAKKTAPYNLESNSNRKLFNEELKDHASGFLAPLIKDLQVFWDSPLLQEGLAIVDLPGIGIAGDVHREITTKWIRKARAIVLVVDSRGITQASADLLYKTGFLNSLLYTSDDPADDPVLMVAVVKVDDIADSKFAEDRSKRKAVHFQEVCAETIENVKAQLRAQLEKDWSKQSDEGSQQRTKVLNNLMNTLQIHPVSAIQYRRILENDDEDRPFLSLAVQTNIPRFSTSLEQLVRSRRERIKQSLDEAADNFFLQTSGVVNLISAQWQEGGRAQEESDRLRSEVMTFIEPRRKEFYSRQGAYREFLSNTIPQRIDALVREASVKAEKDIQRYLRTLDDAHWNTLRAAVRKGGTFRGARHIELPKDFALKFEEPVAEVWATKILKEIRATTKDFTEDCVSLVGEVVSWAKEQGTRVSPALVEAQQDAIKVDSKKLTAVGKEIVDEMRDFVKTKLLNCIEPPIKRKCVAFVKKGDDVGQGVKARILDLFRELAEDVVAAAAEPAVQLLVSNFRLVEGEIKSVLKQYEDPLVSAADAIVSSHEDRIRRSDAQKRKAVLQEIEDILQNVPEPFRSFKSEGVLK